MDYTRSLGAATKKVAVFAVAGLVVAGVSRPLSNSSRPDAAARSGGPVLQADTSQQAHLVPRVKMTLPYSVPPSPSFIRAGVCGVNTSTDSTTCASAIVKAIDNARKTEPLNALPPSFSLSAFLKLTYAEQIFAIADIERTARGEPAIDGLTTQLDSIATAAALGGRDPDPALPLPLAGGGESTYFGSNWAGDTANPLGADYFWMYDDGPNSPNRECVLAGDAACWGHRENVLGAYFDGYYCPAGSPVNAVMGVAQEDTASYKPSIAEVYMNDCGPPPTMFFTWADVQRLVFGH